MCASEMPLKLATNVTITHAEHTAVHGAVLGVFSSSLRYKFIAQAAAELPSGRGCMREAPCRVCLADNLAWSYQSRGGVCGRKSVDFREDLRVHLRWNRSILLELMAHVLTKRLARLAIEWSIAAAGGRTTTTNGESVQSICIWYSTPTSFRQLVWSFVVPQALKEHTVHAVMPSNMVGRLHEYMYTKYIRA
jgi:hypothetical protein